ncbi:site-2 protease family protein [Rhodovibrio salinarum]|nr:biotin/lipoyl-binding protein [Rhodovibrio salinarum]
MSLAAAAPRAQSPAPGAGQLPDVLPPLRPDLELLEAPQAADGSPSWTIHDPVRNSFFRIGHTAFQLLANWDLGDPRDVLERVNAATPVQVDAGQLQQLLRFLSANQLVQTGGQLDLQDHLRRLAQQKRSPWSWLLHRYLFFRIPLVRPDGFLTATLPLVRPLMRRGFMRLCLALGIIGLLLALRQWETFTHTFVSFLSWQGAVAFAATLAVTKVPHELAHGYMAKAYGCRVRTMGVAFLVFYPVLFTDTTDAWRLVSRRQRLMIGAAGMLAEVMLALLATFAWSFLPDGMLRSGAFLLATVTWTMTLLVNLNPFMRFDGYYLLSDWLGVQNLQARGFALGRWKLRELLFGFGAPPPERWDRRTGRLLLLYAYSTWIWRFFLFLGIAILVYHFFFKVLGLFLMAVELSWFIARPIAQELAQWWQRRRAMRLNRNLIATLAALAGVVLLLTWPWQSRVPVPAVLQAGQHTALFPPVPARLVDIAARDSAQVQQGDLLYRLDSPELEHALRQTQKRIALAEQLLRRQAASAETLGRLTVLEQELAADRTRLDGLRAQQARLSVRAPIAGRLSDVPPELATGQWITREQTLGRIIGTSPARLRGYVRARDVARFEAGAAGRFYPQDPARAPIDVRVGARETVNASRLEIPYLAATYGGGIETERRQTRDAAAEIAGSGLVPHTPVYRVEMAPRADQAAPEQVVPGTVMVDGTGRSLIARAWRSAAAVLIRESGF